MSKVHNNPLVQELRRAYHEIANLRHFALSRQPNSIRETTDVTRFVYDFLIYNSLYSVDWTNTTNHSVIYFPYQGKGRLSEAEKQCKFEEYIKIYAIEKPEIISLSFAPLTKLELHGAWTKIDSDDQITVQTGIDFFEDLRALQQVLSNFSEPEQQKMENVFLLIGKCRCFVYLVRNNIFHGSKTLGKIWDSNQLRRLNVYRCFLNCLTASFFVLVEQQGNSEPS